VYCIKSEIDKDYAGELSCHNLFAYACQLTNLEEHVAVAIVDISGTFLTTQEIGMILMFLCVTNKYIVE